ncbi:MAG: hypothetical protein HQ517_18330 [SAR324 cluster bacterium]|nr:hypothetical protein [SAR324 cluster bacterium]
MIDKKKIRDILFKVLMITIPVVLGIDVFLIMSKSKKPPQHKEVVSDIPTVRVMEVKPIDIVPRAVGYGTSRPVKTWNAIAQVSGKIIRTHPRLQKGSIIRQGEELLRIDPTVYRINLAKIKANTQNYKVQIQQLNVEKDNNHKLLELQKADLNIKIKEVNTQKKLYKKNIISKIEYESQLRGLISQQVQVQNIQNALNLVPVKLDLLRTQLDQAKSDQESANLQLSYTTVNAPFDIQVVEVSNKISEFVQTGKAILEANDISETEVEAQFIMSALKPIFLSVMDKARSVDVAISIGEALGIKAKVKLASNPGGPMEWPASFNRRSDTLDQETRTIGLIVVVKNNIDAQGKRGERFLFTGAYCEVELQGEIQKNLIAIPRSALHPKNIVLLMDSEQKLVKKQIEVLYTLSDLVVVKNGIAIGETIILSDIIPAVEGMKVDPVTDHKLIEKLLIDARGEQS